MVDPTYLRDKYRTSPTKQPLANNLADLMESKKDSYQKLIKKLIHSELRNFVADHLEVTNPSAYHTYLQNGLSLSKLYNSKGLRDSLRNLS